MARFLPEITAVIFHRGQKIAGEKITYQKLDHSLGSCWFIIAIETALFEMRIPGASYLVLIYHSSPCHNITGGFPICSLHSNLI